jgi:hypothetical protein
MDENTLVVGKAIDAGGPLFVELFGDAFGAVNNVAEIKAVVLHAVDWDPVRKFGRDVLDIETCGVRPFTGARLWGHPFFTYAGIPEGSVWVVGENKDGWVKQEIRVRRKS